MNVFVAYTREGTSYFENYYFMTHLVPTTRRTINSTTAAMLLLCINSLVCILNQFYWCRITNLWKEAYNTGQGT